MLKIVFDKNFDVNNFKYTVGITLIILATFDVTIFYIDGLFAKLSLNIFNPLLYRYMLLAIGVSLIFTKQVKHFLLKIKNVCLRLYIKYRKSRKSYIIRYIDRHIEELTENEDEVKAIDFLKKMKRDFTI